jgi:hypothetical protein
MKNNGKYRFPVTDRRKFLKNSLIGGLSFFSLPSSKTGLFAAVDPDNRQKDYFNLSRDIITKLFDGQRCWAQARAGIVPGAGKDGLSRVVMTMNELDLSGSDVYRHIYGLQSDDMGKSWTAPKELKTMSPRYETINNIKYPVANADFQPKWHKTTKTLLGIGHTVFYTPDWKVTNPRPRHTSFSVYNPLDSTWAIWEKMKMPDSEKFNNSGAGCPQRFDESDGNILLPLSFRPPGKNSHVTVTRCLFDGKVLSYQEHGNEIAIDDETRGLHEPSLTYFEGEYFLTIRNDKMGFVSRSTDGLHFSPIQPWKFDDGTDLGNYNTQQHWVTHSDGLFLVYTRRGAGNDHVFRHRAPLFIAQVDTQKLRVLRKTERILVPERGARLGNFGVTDVSRDETWVTVSEWMQPEGVEKYGSEGAVFAARIHWNKPNRNVDINNLI